MRVCKTEELNTTIENNQLLPFFDPNPSRICPQSAFLQIWWYGTTVQNANLEMEPKYLTKTDVQLNPNTLRTKNDEIIP